MEDKSSFLSTMLNHLRTTCKYHTGYPKDVGPSRVIHFTSEREFVQLLHQGHPMVVAFTIRGNYTQHLDKVLEEAAVEFYPHVKFMRVECPKYPGFCITRQKKEYPFIEIFHSPEQAANQGKLADPNITKYAVKVMPVLNVLTQNISSTKFQFGKNPQESVLDRLPSITKDELLQFNYDLSAYGFREYFKRHGIQARESM